MLITILASKNVNRPKGYISLSSRLTVPNDVPWAGGIRSIGFADKPTRPEIRVSCKMSERRCFGAYRPRRDGRGAPPMAREANITRKTAQITKVTEAMMKASASWPRIGSEVILVDGSIWKLVATIAV